MADEIRAELDKIRRLMNENQSDAAERRCREAIANWSDDVNLIAMLGAVLASKGDTKEAEKYLRLAIETEPAFARPYEDLGALRLASNDHDSAIPLFHKARSLDPNRFSGMRGLAAALHLAGRHKEASELLDKARAVLPTEDLIRDAEALRANGEIAEAEQVCDIVLRRDPESTSALRVLAKAATDDERFVVAEGYLKRIIKLSPQQADVLFDLGKFLGDRGRYPEAISALQAAASISAHDPDVQLHLGNMLGIVGRTEDALVAYQKCLANRADDPAALIGRGHMLRIAGRQDEAKACYERCTEVCPEVGAAWWYLASLHRYAASEQDMSEMQAQLKKVGIDSDSEVGIRFALARAFENRERFDAAWEQYSLGNTSKRKLVKYDPVKTELNNQKIKDTFSRSLFAREAAKTPTVQTPIFILGMPRSGSTLIEQILASHSQVEGCGELPYILMLTSTIIANKPGSLHYTELMNQLTAEELTGLGQSYLHNAATHCGDASQFFTDKMPANYPHVGFIQRILPHAKFIDARREPLATCIANYRQLFAQGKNQSYDLVELGEHYIQYVDIMAHWDKVLPGQVLRVQYENVVTDLEGQVCRLLEFCNLSFESSCIEFHKSQRAVNTASAEQVREPIYGSAVEYWKNYDPYLGELKEVLAPIL